MWLCIDPAANEQAPDGPLMDPIPDGLPCPKQGSCAGAPARLRPTRVGAKAEQLCVPGRAGTKASALFARG